MARPQRTPARSPDSIVEVNSKVRAPPASALATALAVSYTHLDVYKRQALTLLFTSTMLSGLRAGVLCGLAIAGLGGPGTVPQGCPPRRRGTARPAWSRNGQAAEDSGAQSR
ncbi:hypothetical protein NN561_007012 [Cricetulus griseus]